MPSVLIQDVAHEFYSDDKYIDDLVYHTGYDVFMIYNNGHYRILNKRNEFRRLVTAFVRQKFPNKNWTMNSVDDVIKWITVEAPNQIEEEDDHLIAFKDKLYNLKTGKTEPFDKEKYCIHYVPFNYDETTTETPVFDKFLETSMTYQNGTEPDPSLVKAIKEMLGALFIPNVKAGKAFFLYGKKGDNGKGVLSNLIREIIGRDFCSALSLEDLSGEFNKHKLIGKKVNVSDELDEKFGKSRIFKAIVTGDPIFARRLYNDGFDFIPKTKLVFSTNRMPTFDGIDGGLRRRIRIIPFYKSFTNDEKKDYNLSEKLMNELPGIIGIALKEASELMDNNYKFIRCKAIDEAHLEFLSEVSSALMFFNECYYVDKDGKYPISNLYYDYRVWCDENGKKPMSKPNFSRDLQNNVDGIESKVKKIEGKSVRCYNCFKSDDESLLLAQELSDDENIVDDIEF